MPEDRAPGPGDTQQQAGGAILPPDKANQQTAEGFLEKAKNLLTDLLEVKVVTAVGDVDITISTVGDSTVTHLNTGEHKLNHAIVTIFKLADGDVTTVVSEDLLANAELRTLHAAQVVESLEVLPRNLKLLVEIAKSLRDL